jgi:Bacteriophage tail sheath protein
MSATTLTFRGRLPGVDCSPALPPAEQPIRLDVAALVGFAERGPVGVPVAVPDYAGFGTIFGGDLVLATDDGKPVYAQLPQAVKAFFDNGGVRCYALRVAGRQATAARWVLPNAAVWFADGEVGDAVIQAAWPGGWSDDLTVAVEPYGRPLATAASYQRAGAGAGEVGRGELRLPAGVAATVQVGDLLDLDLGGAGLYVRVGAVAGGRVTTDLEVGYGPGSPPEGRVPDPGVLGALGSVVGVATVVLHRFDLVVRRLVDGQQQQLERFGDLGFGHHDSVLQPSGSAEPDPSRSLNLRADAATDALLRGGLLVPLPGAPAQSGSIATAGRDDLDTFDPVAIFLDDRLAGSTVFSLLPDADSLTSLAAEPAQLRGIHALLGVEDVAMVACPDLVQRGWVRQPAPSPDPPPPPPPPEPAPDWSRFLNCDDGTAAPPAASGADVGLASPTSAGRVLEPVASYDAGPLLDVQRALITLCAARADLVALLSLPLHLDAAATLDWQSQLTATGALTASTTSALTPLSYAGFWHPWLLVPEPTTPQLDPLRALAPDGAVAGMIAGRELARGVWVAPAYQALHGPVGLRPALTQADVVRLFDAHACVITHRPGAFAPLAAHTLAEASLLQLSVRRLLILVRKIALRAGQRYVFEVDNDRFRDLVRRRFQRILDQLVRAGALHAGHVVVDDTADATENGQLIVTLHLAPSSPIEFITVTLVRTGEGLLEVWEG